MGILKKFIEPVDMTEGSPWQKIVLFAVPMLVGNIAQQLYNTVDSVVVGNYVGDNALAAVGSAGPILNLLIVLFVGISVGAGIMVSQYFGAREREKLSTTIGNCITLTGIATLFVMIVASMVAKELLDTPDSIIEWCQSYLLILFIGSAGLAFYNILSGVLRGLGDSMSALLYLLVSTMINIVLDLLFVAKMGMGVNGVALATVIAQAVSGLGLGLYLWKKEPYYRFSPKRFLREEKPVGEICGYSLMTGMQQSVMNFGILMVQSLVNSFGPAVMAAFAATVKIDTFAYMPAQEFGNAYSIFISQNFGAEKTERVKQGTGKAMTVSAVFCGLISALVFAFARFLMLIFVDAGETEIIEIGMQYLRIEGAFYIGIGILFLLYGYFRGVNRPGVSLVLTVISLGTRVALAYILAAVPGIGVLGIWWAIPIGWALADVTGFVLMRRGGTYGEK